MRSRILKEPRFNYQFLFYLIDTPLVGLSPLLKAISKLQMSEKCLTSVHADVVKLSLASKCFTSPILDLLNLNYNEISREATSNTKSLLLFFYYGGMIAASVKVNNNCFLQSNFYEKS